MPRNDAWWEYADGLKQSTGSVQFAIASYLAMTGGEESGSYSVCPLLSVSIVTPVYGRTKTFISPSLRSKDFNNKNVIAVRNEAPLISRLYLYSRGLLRASQ
ncbi:hypothetical protein SNE26_15045 [Mucilaginibacter sp. cycad4]|uniref:hypothetical protein n=1 Tax=Mucilaginibacter sp. cycad4 TaxID=3342096 RepID=UPI002AAB9C10|nr:hypothetical protein [Mucilaginibacter gossypii]WPU97339.1 hypothetical protein SNE26_15045 [Mucilaginibacter gossypii]